MRKVTIRRGDMIIEAECTDDEFRALVGLDKPIETATSNPQSIPNTSQQEEITKPTPRLHDVPKTKEGALQLVSEGWLVRGPYLYGSKTKGQALCLRLQHPREGTLHRVFQLDEADREEVLAIARLKGQFRERVFTEQEPEPTVSEPEKKPDIMVPETPVMKLGVRCRKCGNKVIKEIVNNRHAQSIFQKTAYYHYDETGHKDSCYLDEIQEPVPMAAK